MRWPSASPRRSSRSVARQGGNSSYLCFKTSADYLVQTECVKKFYFSRQMLSHWMRQKLLIWKLLSSWVAVVLWNHSVNSIGLIWEELSIQWKWSLYQSNSLVWIWALSKFLQEDDLAKWIFSFISSAKALICSLTMIAIILSYQIKRAHFFLLSYSEIWEFLLALKMIWNW